MPRLLVLSVLLITSTYCIKIQKMNSIVIDDDCEDILTVNLPTSSLPIVSVPFISNNPNTSIISNSTSAQTNNNTLIVPTQIQRTESPSTPFKEPEYPISSIGDLNSTSTNQTKNETETNTSSQKQTQLPTLPVQFTESIFNFGGLFASCFASSPNFQFSTYNLTDYQSFIFNKETDGSYTIKSKGKNLYLSTVTTGKLLCLSKTISSASKFILEIKSENEFYLKQSEKYITAKIPSDINLISSAIPSSNETFYWTSIPYQEVTVSSFLPKGFCRDETCTVAALKFKKNLYFNAVLHACPDERRVILYGYKDLQTNEFYLIIGYGNNSDGTGLVTVPTSSTIMRYIYMRPGGSVDNMNMLSKTRFSLLKVEFSSNNSFYLKFNNGKYICHQNNISNKPILIELKDEKDNTCLFIN